MKKFATISSILALTLAPFAAMADESVSLLTSKSSGSLDGAVSDTVIAPVTQVAPAGPVSSGGGARTAAIVGGSILGLVVLGAILDDDDDNSNSTTTSTDGGGDSDG